MPSSICLQGTGAQTRDDNRAYIRRVGLMTAIAITAHNFPEGLATFFATLESPAVGMPLAFAIAIHNIPEGIAIAVPVYFATATRSTQWAPACSADWPNRSVRASAIWRPD